jgi:hypothetical protein
MKIIREQDINWSNAIQSPAPISRVTFTNQFECWSWM